MKFEIPLGELTELVSVGHVADTDTVRGLDLVRLEVVAGTNTPLAIRATATDSYVLAIITKDVEDIAGTVDESVLVNAKKLLAAVKSLGKSGRVSVNVAPGDFVTMTTPNTVAAVTVVDRHYPATDTVLKLVPADSAYVGGVSSVGVNLALLAKCAKVGPFAVKNTPMRLNFVDDSRPVRITTIRAGFDPGLVVLLMPVKVYP